MITLQYLKTNYREGERYKECESGIQNTCDIKNVFDVLLKLEIKFRPKRHIKYDMWMDEIKGEASRWE